MPSFMDRLCPIEVARGKPCWSLVVACWCAGRVAAGPLQPTRAGDTLADCTISRPPANRRTTTVLALRCGSPPPAHGREQDAKPLRPTGSSAPMPSARAAAGWDASSRAAACLRPPAGYAELHRFSIADPTLLARAARAPRLRLAPAVQQGARREPRPAWPAGSSTDGSTRRTSASTAGCRSGARSPSSGGRRRRQRSLTHAALAE
jgi:hypothetical protein